MIFSFVFYFFITFLLEFIVLSLFLRKGYFAVFLYVFLINLFTWPLANLAYGLGVNFFLVELCVVFAESVLIMLLFRLVFRKSLLISFLANGLSALAGFLLSFSSRMFF